MTYRKRVRLIEIFGYYFFSGYVVGEICRLKKNNNKTPHVKIITHKRLQRMYIPPQIAQAGRVFFRVPDVHSCSIHMCMRICVCMYVLCMCVLCVYSYLAKETRKNGVVVFVVVVAGQRRILPAASGKPRDGRNLNKNTVNNNRIMRARRQPVRPYCMHCP